MWYLTNITPIEIACGLGLGSDCVAMDIIIMVVDSHYKKSLLSWSWICYGVVIVSLWYYALSPSLHSLTHSGLTEEYMGCCNLSSLKTVASDYP